MYQDYKNAKLVKLIPLIHIFLIYSLGRLKIKAYLASKKIVVKFTSSHPSFPSLLSFSFTILEVFNQIILNLYEYIYIPISYVSFLLFLTNQLF